MNETYFGGNEPHKHESKKLKAARGAVGKTAVVGAKDLVTKKVAAKAVAATDRPTLHGFVKEHAAPTAYLVYLKTS